MARKRIGAARNGLETSTGVESTKADLETTGVCLRVLGVDPGLNITGYGLLEVSVGKPRILEAGVIRSPSDRSLDARLSNLFQSLTEIIESFKPTAMAVEQLYSHYERPRTAILMGHARGVIVLTAAQKQIPVRHYAATKVKRLLTGNGRAPKGQVQLAIQREFQLRVAPNPPDIADALAVALCHVYASRSKI